MEIAQIASRMGLPEERVAQIMTMVRTQGMPEAQMAPMMRMATERGLAPREIAEVMCSLGLPATSVVHVLRAEGLVDDAEARALLRDFDPATAHAAEREARAAEHAAKDTERVAKGAERTAKDAGRAAKDAEHALAWRAFAKKAGIIVFWLAVWELLDHVVDNRLILAGPIRTAEALVEQVAQPDFLLICAASFGRISLGFLLAFVVGFALALLCYKVRLARDFLDPIISLLKTIPMASFVILLLIWVGTQALTVYLAFLIVVPIIYTNVLTGFESADVRMLEMARVYRLSRWRTFWYVYRPAFMPFLYSSCKLSLGMSWKAGIMAELLAVPALSIGKEMYAARTFLDTPDLLAWTVVVMVLSLAFEKAFLWVLRLLQRPMGGFLGAKGAGAGGAAGVGKAQVAGSTQERQVAGAAGAADAGAGGALLSANAGEALAFDCVSKAFGSNQVLDACSLFVEAGATCCLMAPSGSGKTTLFRVMLGLESQDSGQVSGVEAGRVSMMFQEDRLCETLTPVENVALVCPKATRRQDVRALLAEVLPESCLDQPVMELSGGMRRRVALVRAVAFPGSLMVLDEPFTGLDAATRQRVIGFIVRHKGARTLVVATHGEGDAALLGCEPVTLASLNSGSISADDISKGATL